MVRGFSWFLGPFRPAGGLIVAAGIDREFAQQFAGGGVDDRDVEVVDEHEDVGSRVGSTDADVVQLSCDAQGDATGGADATPLWATSALMSERHFTRVLRSRHDQTETLHGTRDRSVPTVRLCRRH